MATTATNGTKRARCHCGRISLVADDGSMYAGVEVDSARGIGVERHYPYGCSVRRDAVAAMHAAVARLPEVRR